MFSISSPLASQINVFDAKFQILKIPARMMRYPKVKAKIMAIVASYFAWNFEITGTDGIGPALGFFGEVFPSNSFRAAAMQKPIMGQYKAVLVDTWLYLVSRGRQWLLLGVTGSVESSTGRYLGNLSKTF